MDNFDLKKYMAEGRLLKENMDLKVYDQYVELMSDSGDYDGEIKDGKVSFSVVYVDDDDRDGMDFDEDNWKDILGLDHAFTKISSQLPTEVEALGDYVMITVDLEDLKGMIGGENEDFEDLTEGKSETTLSNQILDFLESNKVIQPNDAQKIHKALTKFLEDKNGMNK